MEIFINDEKTLGQIKEEFNQHFPHLKIEFYGEAHKSGEGSPEKYHLDDKLSIGQARSKHNEGHLSINGQQKTNTLESRFKEHYGLNVQLFRKSGKIWLQSTSTDEWTLSHQEETAAEHEKMGQNTEVEFPDFD